MDRVTVFEIGGCRFESCRGHFSVFVGARTGFAARRQPSEDRPILSHRSACELGVTGDESNRQPADQTYDHHPQGIQRNADDGECPA
jgi:hypothetical protein